MKTVYHAGPSYNLPLCGTRGSMNGFKVVVLRPAEWNALPAEQRCSKCVAKIRAKKNA